MNDPSVSNKQTKPRFGSIRRTDQNTFTVEFDILFDDHAAIHHKHVQMTKKTLIEAYTWLEEQWEVKAGKPYRYFEDPNQTDPALDILDCRPPHDLGYYMGKFNLTLEERMDIIRGQCC